jgi:hypothetical protein
MTAGFKDHNKRQILSWASQEQDQRKKEAQLDLKR